MRSKADPEVRSATVFSPRTFKSAYLIPIAIILTGCASMQVHLGMKVYLEKTPLQSMKVSLAKDSAIGPGQKLPLVVTFIQPDGKTLLTEGAGHGKAMWKDLQIAASVVTANPKGIISLPRDPRISDGKVPHVTVTVPSHPGLQADLDIPITYDEKYVANFSGALGMSGMNGMDGTDGISGSMGSTDPNNPSPGGNGTNGSDGSNGGDGEPGGDAPPVQVRISFRSGTHPLLQIGVSAKGQRKFYLVDPQGGSLTVKADGGPGGSGGRGGRGGRGGSGGTGTPNGQDGTSGSDGRSGSDGPQGRGGKITVTYDPQAKPYLASIHLSAGNGPAPAFEEAAVGPLW
jgi:hypothetical protein